METQESESIDISSIKRELLRGVWPSQPTQPAPPPISESDAVISSNLPLSAVKHAFQQAIASEHGEVQNTGTTQTNTQRPEQQVTQGFSHLASTVPDSQGVQPFIDVSTSLQPLAPSDNPALLDKGRLRRMATQSSPHDTQELSPSYYASLINVNKSKSVRELEEVGKSQDADDGVTQHTAHTGDPDHIDLGLSDSGDGLEEGQDAEAELDSEPVEFSPTQATQNRLSQFPESQRFKTPATNGKKRNYLGEVVESPALPRNPLAPNGIAKTPTHALGLSQAFAATQAGSSPLLTRHTSVPTSDRPSPNIAMQTRPATASLSSPLRPHSELRGLINQPQSQYISIKQSQAERERVAALRQQSLDGIAAGDQSDDDFDDEPSMVARKRRQREREEHIRERFARFSGSNRPVPAGTKSNPLASTNGAATSSPFNDYDRRSGCQFTTGEETTQGEAQLADESEEETDREDLERITVPHSSQQEKPGNEEEDKENLHAELPQVPETVARLHQVLSEADQRDESPLLRRSLNGPPHNHAPDLATLQDPPKRRFVPCRSPVVAVANSQPDQSVQKRHVVEHLRSSQLISSGTHVSSSAVAPTQVNSSPQQQPSRVVREDPYFKFPVGNGLPTPSEKLSHEVTELPPHHSRIEQPNVIHEPLRGTRDERHEKLLSKPFVLPPSTMPETLLIRDELSVASHDSSLPLKAMGHASSEQPSHSSKRSSKYETAQTHVTSETPVARPLNALFSSPSGTKRKRLGDIATQPSPKRTRVGTEVEEIIAAMDDSEFYAAVADAPGSSSPIPPGRNSRRLRAMGKRAVSSRATSTSVDSHLPSSPPTSVTVAAGQMLEKAAHGQSSRTQLRPPRQSEAIWDVQLSPPKPVPARPTRNTALSARQTSKGASKTQSSKTQSSKSVKAKRVAVVEPPLNDRNQHTSPRPSPNEPVQNSLNHQEIHQTSTEILAPNQVLACFNGNPRGYYPATCIGHSGIRSEGTYRYQIQWDDSSRDDIDEHGIRRLDLRIGDQVKVNLPGWPRISHIVKGFKDRVLEVEGEVTDVRGFKTLLLTPKKRKSLPADVSTDHVKEAPISAIYLDTNMWGQMKDRTFHLDLRYDTTALTLAIPQQVPSRSGLATPSERPSTPSTPSSRTRRKSDFPAQSASTALPSTSAPAASGIFSNMAFAISYAEDVRKTSLAKAISANGGTLLSEDFHEMFEQPSSPAASSRRTAQVEPLALNTHFSNIGFVALVADRHSRKPKYMQALALNLPCLSGKWIEACVAAKMVMDWRPYLLSAGESLELDGAVRSRVLSPIEAETALLRDIISGRPNFLQEGSIIVVTGKGKAEGKRKPYLFLTKAAGAGTVEECADLKQAKGLLDGDTLDEFRWVFVDDRDVKKAEASLLAKGKDGEIKHVRVVGNEFLCQSLILGRLWEQA